MPTSMSDKVRMTIIAKPGLAKTPFTIIEGKPMTMERFVSEGLSIVPPDPTSDVEQMKILTKSLYSNRRGLNLFFAGGRHSPKQVVRHIDQMDKVGKYLVGAYTRFLKRWVWSEIYGQQ